MKYNIFNIPYEERAIIGLESYIYGFPTDNGMKQLVNIINSLKTTYNIEYIHGIDLGCGDGKLIDYFNKNISESEWTGIELSETRIASANYANNNNIIHGDLLSINYDDYNFLFINNVCFEQWLCERIEYKINNEFNGYILFSKKPQTQVMFKNATLVDEYTVSMNWSKSHTVYVYRFG